MNVALNIISDFGQDGAKLSSRKHDMKIQTLERVEMVAVNGGMFPQMNPMSGPEARWMWPSLLLVKRTWVAEREVRDDSRNIFHVREIGKGRRMEAQAKNLEGTRDFIREVWQRAWPTSNATNGAPGWWEQWESRPLEL